MAAGAATSTSFRRDTWQPVRASSAQKDRQQPGSRWRTSSCAPEPAPRRFTHHLELYSEAEIDDEVRRWPQEAWDLAQSE